MKKELIEAYLQTSFRAGTPRGSIELRVGRRNRALDLLLSESGSRSWAYITAFNPNSHRLSHQENLRRHKSLWDEIWRRGFRTFEGEGVAADRKWPPEKSFLVLGISRDEASRLGRTFGQRAIVVGQKNRPAEMVAFPDSRLSETWRIDTAGRRWMTIEASANDAKRWPDPLARIWRRRYQQLFDDADRDLALSMGRRSRLHFVEWVAAMHLFHTSGASAVLKKWNKRRFSASHPTKCLLVCKILGKDRYEQLCHSLLGQGPDLFLYKPRTREFAFAEIKRNDSLSKSQKHDQRLIERTLKVPVTLIRVKIQ